MGIPFFSLIWVGEEVEAVAMLRKEIISYLIGNAFSYFEEESA